MTQENKELLLKDLCSRLPYGVKVSIKNSKNHSPITVCGVTREYICVEGGGEKCFSHGTYQPYLRPMSSMTDEERIFYNNANLDGEFGYNPYFKIPAIDIIDWLIKKMFDYCGLIPKGLALEASEGMYK